MAMMKTMINKQAPAGISEPTSSSIVMGTPTAPQNIQCQLAELQRQVRPWFRSHCSSPNPHDYGRQA